MMALRTSRPAPRFLALTAGLLGLAVTAGCYADARTCQHDSDCFRSEVCRNLEDGEGECVEQSTTSDAEPTDTDPTDTPARRDTRPRDTASDGDSGKTDATPDTTTNDTEPTDTRPDGGADTTDDPICTDETDCPDPDSCNIADCRDGQCIEEPRCEGTDRDCGCESCEDCTEKDGWYPTGAPTPCCDGGYRICGCTEQEYREYSCDGTSCEYEVTDTRTEVSGCSDCTDGCCNDGQCYEMLQCP